MEQSEFYQILVNAGILALNMVLSQILTAVTCYRRRSKRTHWNRLAYLQGKFPNCGYVSISGIIIHINQLTIVASDEKTARVIYGGARICANASFFRATSPEIVLI